MRESFSDATKAYSGIMKQKEKSGKFRKTLLHVHTPASYDYKLLGKFTDQDYLNATDQEIYNECISKRVFPNVFSNINQINYGDFFSSLKEFLSYILIAHELSINDVEIVVVCDHNTLNGIQKLTEAIKVLNKNKKQNTYTEVIAGIEVSCADRIHVVAMFDWKNNNVVNEIKSWLKANLLSEQDGVFRTSYDTMSELTDKGAICYIAHINTSDMFKDQKYLTGGYRNRLLSSNHALLIGVSSLEKRKDVSRFLIEYRKDNIKYLLDNDAHDIDDLSKNYFWVKGHKINYQMFEEALIDYDVSISFEKEHTAAQYIKGVYIEENLFESSNGFLSGKKHQPFVVRFSKSLNCFIGGRGTGKSSILELLQYVLSQRCKSVDMLEFLCKHGTTWILYEYNNEEYMIKMNMPVPTGLETHVLHRFGQNIEERYNYKYRFDEDEVAAFAFSQYLEIYKVVDNDNNGIYFEKQTKKRELLDKMFDTKYSVNDLVSTASGDDINLFIYNLMMRKKELSSVSDVVRARSLSGFMNTIEKIKITLAQRKQEVEMILSDFNKFQEKRLRILYYQELKVEEPPVSDWFLPRNSLKDYCFNFAITKENILDYLLSVFDGEGIFGFFEIIAKKKLTSDQYPIIHYMDTDNNKIMNTNANAIDEGNQQELINKVIREVYTDINCSSFISYLRKSLTDAEEFVLEFNVNSKTAVVSAGCLYKDVRQLSLGQKVVAMLDFVLAYSDYSEDYRPLIIDQPEDNLDSQYIYNNLVQQLRDVKEKRQVIIATHNATIVTNAKADQVIIMESDNNHGTVKTYGYPGENTIKKYIINYLEGGIDSFKHKVSVYSPVLK